MSAFRVPYLQPFAFALPAETTWAVSLANFIRHFLVKTLKTAKMSLVNTVTDVNTEQFVFSNSHTIKQMAAKHCKHWIVLHEGGVLSMIFFYYFFVYQFTVLLVSKWGDREVIWHNMDVKVQKVLDFHNSWYFFSLQWKYRTRFRVKHLWCISMLSF